LVSPPPPPAPGEHVSRAAALRARSLKLHMAALKVLKEQAREVPPSGPPLPLEPRALTKPVHIPLRSSEAASSNPDIALAWRAPESAGDDELARPVRRRELVFAPAALAVLATIAVLMQGPARLGPPTVAVQAGTVAKLPAWNEPVMATHPALVAERAGAALAAGASYDAAPALAKKSAETQERSSSSSSPSPSLQRPAAAEPLTARAESALANDRFDPSRAKMLADLASEVMIGGGFAAAANAYQHAISADPNYAPAWRGKGLALERLGKTQDAAAAFRRFLKLEPQGASSDKIRERLSVIEP
jgi:tetratricopeptide (TPR) repeat protein